MLDEQVSWEKPWEDYAPTHFEAEVLAKNVRGMETGGGWADPAEIGPELEKEISTVRKTFENGGTIRCDAALAAAYLRLISPILYLCLLGSNRSHQPHSPRAWPHIPLPTAHHLPPPGWNQGSLATLAGAPG